MFSGVWYMVHAFLSNIKMEQLQITVLKRRDDLSKTINIFKRHFYGYQPKYIFKVLLNGL